MRREREENNTTIGVQTIKCVCGGGEGASGFLDDGEKNERKTGC